MAIPIFTYGKVRPLRQAKGLNQAEIAAELGISRPTYVMMAVSYTHLTLPTILRV